MGRSYICEYCGKSFRDNYLPRKSHNQSKRHQEARLQYYSQYKDELMMLKEELDKKPCHWFQKGICKYGDDCKHCHLTTDHFEKIKANILTKYRSLKADDESPLEAELAVDEIPLPVECNPVFQYCQANNRSIPISLRPPAEGELIHKDDYDWQ